ncbi:hypothetical protein O9K51_11353 [Purpureocillium lavendulum]|uniref:Uncharacterized protein n=1 Tax=Purpureocillium lavendulum TaxID=1247861 RepID=A0AB34FAV7_9HYPO|nr:hypothetical protein O9K51_11353 [Purpureocillium lavendulum]
MSLSANANPTVAADAGSKLKISKEGEVVPLESTLEIKTRVFHKRLEIRDAAPQLWVSQTPKLVRAYHGKGFFQEPEVEDVTAAVKRWEEDSQEDLRKLASLVNRILTMAKELGESTVMKYDAMADKLVIAKVAGEKMLPTDLYSKWDDASADYAAEAAELEPSGGTSAQELAAQPRDLPLPVLSLALGLLQYDLKSRNGVVGEPMSTYDYLHHHFVLDEFLDIRERPHILVRPGQ